MTTGKGKGKITGRGRGAVEGCGEHRLSKAARGGIRCQQRQRREARCAHHLRKVRGEAGAAVRVEVAEAGGEGGAGHTAGKGQGHDAPPRHVPRVELGRERRVHRQVRLRDGSGMEIGRGGGVDDTCEGREHTHRGRIVEERRGGGGDRTSRLIAVKRK